MSGAGNGKSRAVVSLTIDGRQVEVPKGTLVIDAAERLGIIIPRFCYHEALGNVGACRMCAVMFLEGHRKPGIDMSCMVQARDGMVVETDHPEAMAFRASVIEWLMLNHPLDCPVCDEGGHCLLQDTTVSGGHSIRRYFPPKRTYLDQDLGPLVEHEMNRCIHCYRCVRFYRDYAGYQDLGVFGMAQRVYFGRVRSGRLESPFCGNLIDICPTGVYTDKPSRYRARRWDMERAPGVCLHCSLGCAVTPGARYREVLRIEAREQPEVNGHFICDRGRYGFEYANLGNRPRTARVNGRETSVEEAVRAAAGELSAKAKKSVACLGSPRASLESLAMLRILAREAGFAAPAFFGGRAEREICREAVSEVDGEIARSLEDIRNSDLVMVACADPLGEAPMLALALRQVARRGGAVAVLDPRPLELPCEFIHLPVPRGDVAHLLGNLTKAALPELESELDAMLPSPGDWPAGVDEKDFDRLREALASAKRPVLVCGTRIAPAGMPELAASLVRLWRETDRDAGIFFLLPGPNAFGAALLDSPGGRSLEGIIEAIEAGTIKTLLCVEADPPALFPDPERARKALAKLDLLLVLDYLPSAGVEKAGILLPTQNVFEAGGGYVNQEGRLQFSHPVHAGGTPIRLVSDGGHPPREFSSLVPGGDPAPAWRLLADLTLAMNSRAGIPASGRQAAAGELTHFKELVLGEIPATGVRLTPEAKSGPRVAAVQVRAGERDPEAAEALAIESVFGTEELSGYGSLVPGLAGPGEVFLHRADAGAHGLEEGETVLVPLKTGIARGLLRTRDNMARGTLILRRCHEAGAHALGEEVPSLALHQVWKEQQPEQEKKPDEAEAAQSGCDIRGRNKAGADVLVPGEECPWKPK